MFNAIKIPKLRFREKLKRFAIEMFHLFTTKHTSFLRNRRLRMFIGLVISVALYALLFYKIIVRAR